ncbi:MAG: MTH1187 family thiamine-binding protein [Thermoproteota archaeon]
MVVVVEFSIVPVGEGTSLSRILAHAIRELENIGVKYELTPMCTVFEAQSVEEALKAVRIAHEAVFKHGVKRAVTIVKIDDRRDLERSMMDKVESLKKAVGSVNTM